MQFNHKHNSTIILINIPKRTARMEKKKKKIAHKGIIVEDEDHDFKKTMKSLGIEVNQNYVIPILLKEMPKQELTKLSVSKKRVKIKVKIPS